ncbi:ABC transporter ATP-binding protein [Sphingomonas sp. LaA6.9]|uniref:ABC transporter ATP-binding protein n=1 Tax=Sphingomonas sp. LaA6.9 TaxID=2919914 RepID=UPI001F4F2D1D|nr:sn-glycerol-3-phosphate ABC transporter ATP-binding protein UgpC [Sphingomonas sp. LaA6.9]MCJ8156426.1 sn-glycerol-3-phosphate ABC transporter ATP-binding protein UgpC [Sphingomonas sp. LaA6.9]
MADVTLAGARKSFGAVTVLEGIDLEIADGEFVVFVGPSGCGKSTLLRVIAGLEDLDHGELSIGGRLVTDLPAAERGIAMVFQSYALYPHMTIYDNLAFSLKLAKAPKAEIDKAVRAAAKTLGIDHLLDRKPAALSGGQRQRVAIGRAIVRKPRVFLFDEPLSNLDAALRMKMRYEFAALHRQLATTMIYVTHDQAEAMTLADRIVVLSGGRIEQTGRPLALYENPVNLFVAGFIGSPRMNFLPGQVIEAGPHGVMIELRSGDRLRAAVDGSAASAGDAVTLGVRPEHIRSGGAENSLTARVRFVEALGSSTYAHLDHPALDDPINWQIASGAAPAVDAEVQVTLPPAELHLFDALGSAFRRLQPLAQRHAA